MQYYYTKLSLYFYSQNHCPTKVLHVPSEPIDATCLFNHFALHSVRMDSIFWDIPSIYHSVHLSSAQIFAIFYIFLFFNGPGLLPSPLLLASFIGLLYQPWMIDADDCGAISGVSEWQRKPKYSEKKTCPVPLCPPQIPHDLTPVSSSGRPGREPTNNRLRYSRA
jgi:hypothetical protein